MKKESSTEQEVEIASNLLHLSLNYAKFYSTSGTKDTMQTFEKMLENAKTFLKLSTINELVQTFRVNHFVLQALLKAFSFLSGSISLNADTSDAQDEILRDLT